MDSLQLGRYRQEALGCVGVHFIFSHNVSVIHSYKILQEEKSYESLKGSAIAHKTPFAHKAHICKSSPIFSQRLLLLHYGNRRGEVFTGRNYFDGIMRLLSRVNGLYCRTDEVDFI